MSLKYNLRKFGRNLEASDQSNKTELSGDNQEQEEKEMANVQIEEALKNMLKESRRSNQAATVGRCDDLSPKSVKEWIQRVDQQYLPELQAEEADDRKTLALITGPLEITTFNRENEGRFATWNEMRIQLLQNFANLESPHEARQKLSRMVQAKDESLAVYGSRIQQLAQRAFPAENLNAASIVCQMNKSFINGLSNSRVGKYLTRKD